jgi:hypothetical protein
VLSIDFFDVLQYPFVCFVEDVGQLIKNAPDAWWGGIAVDSLADNTPTETCRTARERVKKTTVTCLYAIGSFRECLDYKTLVLLAPSLNHLI